MIFCLTSSFDPFYESQHSKSFVLFSLLFSATSPNADVFCHFSPADAWGHDCQFKSSCLHMVDWLLLLKLLARIWMRIIWNFMWPMQSLCLALLPGDCDEKYQRVNICHLLGKLSQLSWQFNWIPCKISAKDFLLDFPRLLQGFPNSFQVFRVSKWKGIPKDNSTQRWNISGYLFDFAFTLL